MLFVMKTLHGFYLPPHLSECDLSGNSVICRVNSTSDMMQGHMAKQEVPDFCCGGWLIKNAQSHSPGGLLCNIVLSHCVSSDNFENTVTKDEIIAAVIVFHSCKILSH